MRIEIESLLPLLDPIHDILLIHLLHQKLEMPHIKKHSGINEFTYTEEELRDAKMGLRRIKGTITSPIIQDILRDDGKYKKARRILHHYQEYLYKCHEIGWTETHQSIEDKCQILSEYADSIHDKIDDIFNIIDPENLDIEFIETKILLNRLTRKLNKHKHETSKH